MNFLRHKRAKLITFFLAGIILSASAIIMADDGDTSVYVDPSSQTVGPEETLMVTIYCTPSQPIKAYELTVSFDETVLQVVDVTEGDIFDGFTTFFNPGIIDNTNGIISEIYGLIIGTGNVTNPGSLININFTAGDTTASSIIDLVNVGITNETSYVTVTVNDGLVQVDATHPSVVDNSPGFGYTGDSFVFNASVTDNIDSSENLTVKVDWSHGSYGGNISMNFMGGTYFSKVVTLDEESISDMTYKIFSVDSYGNSYTTQTAFVSVSDNDAPTINSFQTIPSPQEIGGFVNISAEVTDNIEMGDVFLNIIYPDDSTENITISQNKIGNIYFYNESYSMVGTYSVYIWACDSNGFSVTSDIYDFEITDINCPVISDINVQTSDPLDTDPAFGWVNISCKVTDDIKVGSVYINILKPNSDYVNESMIGLGDDIYYYNSSIDFSTHGEYDYFIWANDTTENFEMSDTFVFSMPPNWDINMDGNCTILDLVLISNVYGDQDSPGWIREDADNNGEIEVLDLVIVSNHHGESW